MSTRFFSNEYRRVSPMTRRSLLVMLSIMIVIGSTAGSMQPSHAESDRTFTSFGLPPDSDTTAQEMQSNEAVIESVPGEFANDGEPGGLIFMDEVPATMTPQFSAPRVHMQGEHLQHQADEQGFDESSLFPTEPTDEPSPLPVTEQSNAPGTKVHQWKALSNTGWFPPDTIHSVGPGHVVEAVNSGFAVYNKQGDTIQSYTTFDSFMHKPTPWNGFMYDPRVIYSKDHERFLMLILGLDETNLKSYFWIAVSRTSDPTDGWCRWRFDSTQGSGSSRAWLDYAGLGADKLGVYITGNYFRFGSNEFSNALIRTVNPDIFAANCSGQTNGYYYASLTWPSGGSAFSLQPALPHTENSDGEMFFVNTYSGSGNKALLWRLSGNRVTSPSLSRVEIPTATYNAIGNNVAQPGTTVRIDGGDARVMNAVYVNRRVFFTLTTDVNNNGAMAGWLTARLNTNSNTREWQHLLYSGNGFYYFYPAVTVQGADEDNHVAVFGSWTDAETAQSSGTVRPSGLVKFYDNQPTDAEGAFLSFVGGLGAYNRVFSDRNRWGDYSGAAYDWWTGHAWGSVEWADTGNNWATSIVAYGFASEATSHTLTLSKSGIGTGTVTSVPAGIDCGTSCSSTSASFASGTTVRLTASAGASSSFSGWGGACSGTSSTCEIVLNQAASVTANFSGLISPRTLTITKSGAGSGTVTSTPAGINCGSDCSESYLSPLTTVTLNNYPVAGSYLKSWGGDSDCVDGQVTMVSNRACIANFINQASSLNTSQVHTMYIAYFGRPAAPRGLGYYTDWMDETGGNYFVLIDDFWNSSESQSVYGSLTIPERVNQVFRFLFGRDAAASGRNYWSGLIANGTISLPEMAYTVAYNAGASDLAVLDLKRGVAGALAAALNTPAEQDGYNASHMAQARAAMAYVVDTGTRNYVMANLNAIVANIVNGNTWNQGL